MALRLLLSAALSILALVGCATAPATPSPIPSDREVIAFVMATWDHYDRRFAYLSERRGQSSNPISVTNVECGPDGEDAKCTFIVKGRFGDGTVVSQPMESFFQRQPDGSIDVLIPVVYG